MIIRKEALHANQAGRWTLFVTVTGLLCSAVPALASETIYTDVSVMSSVTPLNGDDAWDGYTRLEVSGERITGKLCLRGREPDTLTGRRAADGTIELQIVGLENLGVEDGLLKFKKRTYEDSGSESHWSYAPSDSSDDDARNSSPKFIRLT